MQRRAIRCRNTPTLIVLAGCMTLAWALAGCSGSVENPSDPDAAPVVPPDAPEPRPDARPRPDASAPDAMPTQARRAGLITITETTVTNPGEVATAGEASVSYVDLATATVAPARPLGESPELLYDLPDGACVVYRYTKGTNDEATEVDEAEVTITGGASDIGACTFTAGAYACPAGPSGDFLDGAGTVTVAKAAGAEVAALADVAVAAAGDGFALLAGSTDPHSFPSNSAATFTCSDGNTDNCGATPAGATVNLIVRGRTTDADLNGTGFNEMPEPTSQWAVFECRGTPGEGSITMPMEFVLATLATNPTRIELRVMRVTEVEDSATGTRIRVGHALLGYDDR
ncbi:hypothetical protein [Haliangium sp.]|uniref:hypothetical protein n=1 Tax=Haliangium sp. TaxID=2663208 RepID=UPI003D0D0A59